MFSLICVWINGWVNNREAGDLRRHRGHYDVIVMVPDFTHILLGYSTGTQDIFTIAPIHRKIPCLHFYPMFTWIFKHIVAQIQLPNVCNVISKCVCFVKIVVFWFKFHSCLCRMILLMIKTSIGWDTPGTYKFLIHVMTSYQTRVYSVTHMCVTRPQMFNTLRPRQNGRRFPDDVFKSIFLNENVWIPLKISLKFVPNGPINNIPP